MLLRKLILENYGLFAGRHEFDLAPRTKYGQVRPIILFGGKNGAGKTTLLEAVRHLLYGRLCLGNRVRTVDYKDFLRARIHRRPGGERAPSARLAMEFDHVHRGTTNRYLVERSWGRAGSNDVTETFVVKKNDHGLEDIDAEFWPDFIRDIIPDGLAQLFFFDGEKIRELAEDETGTGVLAESVKTLLGLDLVERLTADLTVYSNREVAKRGPAGDRERAAALEEELSSIRKNITSTQEELAAVRTKTDGVQAEIRRAEEELRREGEDLAKRRHRLQEESTTLRLKIDAAERDLREECDGVFPFALCPSIANLLRGQLDLERSLANVAPMTEAVRGMRNQLRKSLSSQELKRAGVNRGTASEILARIDAAFEKRLTELTPRREERPVHHLSDSDFRHVRQALGEAESRSKRKVQKLCKNLEKWRRRLDGIERSIAQVPADDVVAPRVQAITDLHQRLGAHEQARRELEDQLKRHHTEVEQKERELRKLVEHYREGLDAENRVALAHSVQIALGEYLRRLTELKVSQLKQAVTLCFNRLCRKADVVRNIEIDPATFGATLYDKSRVAIPKEELSSGEKQIFAIAMLWGLARTSGRPLPVIIDTPLGRLDSDHRRNLIREYFPHASHQVILFSTDTEVDQALFAELGPSISHSYQLNYDQELGRTSVSEGYFWRRKEEALCPI